jgi:tetratricopeptide (TPR) repeat protein
MTGRSNVRSLSLALVAISLLFLAIASLQARMDAESLTVAQQKEELLLRSGRLLKALSLGYEPLLADVYWTRTVQYYGGRIGNPGERFELLWPLLDITTTLDPKLTVAYRFGAIFLSEPFPTGGDRSDLAVELVKKGIAANPDDWQLDSDLGFLYYWHLKDYEKASAAYLDGSKKTNAPIWLKMMAAQVAAKGDSFANSREIWTEIFDTTQNPAVKKNAFQHLQSLQAQQDVQALNKYAEDYRKRKGRYPATTREMYESGILSGIPLDPAGIPYVFGSDGKAQLDPKSPVIAGKPSDDPPPQ